jgi:hypothetical protein
VENLIDRFSLYVPQEAEDGMIVFDVSEPGKAQITVCETASGDCSSMSAGGIVHLKKTGQLVSVKVELLDSATTDIVYTVSPSFYSSMNSLRVGYKPVSVAVDRKEKISWQMGYYEDMEWLVTATGTTSDVSACIDDNSPRCCAVTLEGCTIQGFGRQIFWIDNKSDSKVVVKLTTQNLGGLKEGEFVDIVGRLSNIFKLPANGVFRIDSDGDVEYIVGSPDRDKGTVNNEPPIEEMNLKKNDIYAIVSRGTRARLVRRSALLLNHWNEQQSWNHVSSNSAGIALLENSVVRVEVCDTGDPDVAIDGKRASLSESGFVDIHVKEGADVNVDGSSRFRVGLIQNSRIVRYNLELSSILDPIADSDGYIYFTAPSNADGSLYRALCLSGAVMTESSVGRPSQCAIEKSHSTVRGVGVACSPNTFCQIPLAKNCDGFVTVVADRGIGFGAFEPIPIRALFEGIDVNPNGRSRMWFILTWIFAKSLWVLASYMLYRWISINHVLLRIGVMKVIDLIRGKRKYGGREYLLEEELSSVEGGGYKSLRNEGSQPSSHTALYGRSRGHDSHEMHRFNSNRLYHGA